MNLVHHNFEHGNNHVSGPDIRKISQHLAACQFHKGDPMKCSRQSELSNSIESQERNVSFQLFLAMYRSRIIE